jgi:hypothetical protein
VGKYEEYKNKNIETELAIPLTTVVVTLWRQIPASRRRLEFAERPKLAVNQRAVIQEECGYSRTQNRIPRTLL